MSQIPVWVPVAMLEQRLTVNFEMRMWAGPPGELAEVVYWNRDIDFSWVRADGWCRPSDPVVLWRGTHCMCRWTCWHLETNSMTACETCEPVKIPDPTHAGGRPKCRSGSGRCRAVGFAIEWRAKNRPVDEAFQSCWNVAVECIFVMPRWRKVTSSSELR